MSYPFLSVVIPTRGRSLSLARAVDSALSAAPDGEVEVIVVPNGPEANWCAGMNSSLSDPRVRVQPITMGHACVARNHGLSFVKGKYTRFLDDDDVLFPDSARAQLIYMDEVGAEICSGRLQHMNWELQRLSQVGFTDKLDFVCAACEASGFTLPTGNIFLTATLEGARWSEAAPRFQDNVWMMQLAQLREWNWSHFKLDVGGWVHHAGDRISSTAARQPLPHWMMDSLLSLYEALSRDGRINAERRFAITEALWRIVHSHFARFPFQCHRYAQRILEIDPASRPPDFERVVALGISPVFVEWLMVPRRYIRHVIKSTRKSLRGEEVVRKL